ncbi:MAG: RNA polymerase factor sigma-54 [Acidobacteriota bacterium]|nr:RNA polymerase factor sigma-54 [Acidobacteriota bacterium]
MSSLRLQTTLRQGMVLTPQLRQRIEMLQMTSMELNELVQTELVSNPVLEEVQSGDEIQEISSNILDQNSDGHSESFENGAGGDYDPSAENISNLQDKAESFKPENPSENGFEETKAADFETDDETFIGEKSDAFEEIDYGREFQDYLDPGYKTQEFEHKEDAPSFEQFLSHSPSLIEHLEWQLNLQQISERLEDIGNCIIGNLDADGRLVTSNDEIAEMSECSAEMVEKARQAVLRLDPVGCGARDVNECLLAQLESRGEGESLAADLVRNHLEDLQPFRLQHLSKEIGIELHALNEEINKIRLLNPYPGRSYSSEEPIYVSPEVYIEKVEDDYVIYFTDDGSPRLRISQTYHHLLDKTDTSKETKDFIKEKVRSAVDLLRNIEHRRQTIYRVVECIVNRQHEFLDKGVQYIKPMMLKDVAEDIGMHLSTISRVVNRKYAFTPQGVIELRRFFSEGMLNEDGEEVSTRILKLRIKKMVEDEDTKKPLTDEQIAKILSKEGVKLSRRTVAKYRDQMQIPGSRERKTVI